MFISQAFIPLQLLLMRTQTSTFEPVLTIHALRHAAMRLDSNSLSRLRFVWLMILGVALWYGFCHLRDSIKAEGYEEGYEMHKVFSEIQNARLKDDLDAAQLKIQTLTYYLENKSHSQRRVTSTVCGTDNVVFNGKTYNRGNAECLSLSSDGVVTRH